MCHGLDGVCSDGAEVNRGILILIQLTNKCYVVPTHNVQPEFDLLYTRSDGENPLTRILKHNVDSLVAAAQYALQA